MIVALTLSMTACASLPSKQALCDGTVDDRKAHAGALLADGGPMSRDTGERLLSKLRGGCND